MPRLDERLKTVARQICSATHGDVGSDHGHLLVALIKAGRIQRGIAVENKFLPLENSRRSLCGLPADVRFGDGLDAIEPGELDSLSICGLGAKRIVEILGKHPARVPGLVILQPNKRADLVRRWAFEVGFHVMDEICTPGPISFVIIRCERNLECPDPAYDGLPLEDALMFGPVLLKNHLAELREQLREERCYLVKLNRLGDYNQRRLEAIDRVLAW